MAAMQPDSSDLSSLTSLTPTTGGRGRGNRQSEGQPVLRRPYVTPWGDPGAKGDSASLSNSGLSADAKEFVPKCYSMDQFEEAGGGGDAYADTYPVPDHLSDNFLLNAIQDLTLNPGHFDTSADILTDLFLQDLNEPTLIERVIDKVVEKSIYLPNFCYNGARLLCQFRNALPLSNQNDFRRLLLKRCQEENEKLMKDISKNAIVIKGFALFLAELFIQMKVTAERTERLTILGIALFEVMKSLLLDESCENIKSVCQILKLAGLALDEQDTKTMDEIFKRLTEIQNSCEKENMVRLITSIINLRQNAWRPPTLMPPTVAAIENDISTNFYLPNGDTLSPEESQFLDDNIGPCEEYDYSGEISMCSPVLSNCEDDDGEDDGFDEAFEAFLAYSQQSKKSS